MGLRPPAHFAADGECSKAQKWLAFVFSSTVPFRYLVNYGSAAWDGCSAWACSAARRGGKRRKADQMAWRTRVEIAGRPLDGNVECGGASPLFGQGEDVCTFGPVPIHKRSMMDIFNPQ